MLAILFIHPLNRNDVSQCCDVWLEARQCFGLPALKLLPELTLFPYRSFIFYRQPGIFCWKSYRSSWNVLVFLQILLTCWHHAEPTVSRVATCVCCGLGAGVTVLCIGKVCSFRIWRVFLSGESWGQGVGSLANRVAYIFHTYIRARKYLLGPRKLREPSQYHISFHNIQWIHFYVPICRDVAIDAETKVCTRICM